MTKFVLLTSLFLGTVLTGYAQTSQNLDFENWTNHTESEPNMWVTNNVYTPQSLLFCTKVTGAPGFAPHIETLSFGGLAIPGSITNTLGNYMAGEGGVVYTGTTIPTVVKGQYRYNIQNNDSAMLYIVLKKNGAILTRDSFYIKGSQSTFTAFSFNLSSMAAVPDSLIIVATSGAFSLSPGAPAGSYLELDNIALGDGTATYSIVNADFNTWNTVSVDVPDAWSKMGIVNKTTDKVSGNFAAKLITGATGVKPVEAATVNNTLSMSAPTDSLTGYYKYIPSGSDQAPVQLTLNDQAHTQIITLNAILPPAANYTYFAIPLTNSINAAEVSFTFSSSKIPPVDGSSLFLDKIAIKHKTNSVKDVAAPASFRVYPNPAGDLLHIAVTDVVANTGIVITDAKGSMVRRLESRGREVADILISNLPAGTYFCEIKQGDVVVREKFIKQ